MGLIPEIKLVVTEAGALEFMVILIAALIGDKGFGHVALEVTTQVMLAPLPSADVEKAGLLAPVFIPFIFHWYEGDTPPLTAEAENVTGLPEQAGLVPDDKKMEVDAEIVGVTVI